MPASRVRAEMTLLFTLFGNIVLALAPAARSQGPDRVLPNCLVSGRISDVGATPYFSQDTEDATLLRILACVGHGNREFFEFGAQDAMEVNTRLLREEFGWHGHYLDGGPSNPAINLHHAFFNSTNIVSLMQKYGVSQQLDLLSVDSDFDDLYLLREILLAGFRPRVLIVEFRSIFMAHQSFSVLAPRTLNDPRWGNDCYAGASALALTRLAGAFGYALVHAAGVNLFLVQSTVSALF